MTLTAFHCLVVVLGILNMGFQLLASRLLSPHFGSSIIVWAWLISTFLAAFSIGSLLGGWVSSLPPERRFRWQSGAAVLAVATFAFTAFFGRPALDWIEVKILTINAGLLISCVGLFFVPVTMISSFGPQCVQYLAARGTKPGAASGIIYGTSTVGNIAGVMLTAFMLIPNFGISTLLYVWLSTALFGLAGLIAIIRHRPASPLP